MATIFLDRKFHFLYEQTSNNTPPQPDPNVLDTAASFWLHPEETDHPVQH